MNSSGTNRLQAGTEGGARSESRQHVRHLPRPAADEYDRSQRRYISNVRFLPGCGLNHSWRDSCPGLGWTPDVHDGGGFKSGCTSAGLESLIASGCERVVIDELSTVFEGRRTDGRTDV